MALRGSLLCRQPRAWFGWCAPNEESLRRIGRAAADDVTGAPPDPYLGLRPFAARDRDRFYGRRAEVGAVLEHWFAASLTVLFGPPGAGRTSLLQAEVIPAAAQRAGPRAVGLLVSRIGTTADPMAGAAGNPLVRAVLSAWSAQGAWSDPGVPVDPVPPSLPAFLNRLRPPRQQDEPAPILAVIDQFERVFRAYH